MVEENDSFATRARWLQSAVVAGILIIIVVALLLGWCTGDTSKAGNSLTLSNHPDLGSCDDAAARLTVTQCVNLMTPGLNVWAAGQSCTPHGRCKACKKITKIDNSQGELRCISDGQNGLNLVCYNFGYDLDCDCP